MYTGACTVHVHTGVHVLNKQANINEYTVYVHVHNPINNKQPYSGSGTGDFESMVHIYM